MSTPQPEKRRVEDWLFLGWEILDAMNRDQRKFYQAIFATAVCGVLAWEAMRTGYPITSAICAGGIPVVNGLTFREIMRGMDLAREERRRKRNKESD